MGMHPDSTILVTGGAGFIGSQLVIDLLDCTQHRVITLDRLSYAGNLSSLATHRPHPRHHFIQGDINDAVLLREIFSTHRPLAVMHLAAESHVDRSIDGPAEFIQTNVVGTFHLLEACRDHWQGREGVKFHHVSTDEVYGSLGETGQIGRAHV